jgi:hypothetical protein
MTAVEGLRGVAGASASLIERRGQRPALAVDLAQYADIAEVRQAIEDRVFAHARQAPRSASSGGGARARERTR